MRTLRSLRFPISIAAGVLVLAGTPIAQTSIKLATLVPIGSVWDKSLKQMADEFKQSTGGKYEITVYAGGTQGDEPTVLRKMKLDALQAAAFTNTGLGMIDPAFNVFNVP
ncbi:MAG TPA: TRAP transporter substrate-binding protein DctP, partial [Vicinamibacterales bacterium]|nr:TRAP transporter substrate-binding protein DctP [Vicinamibacterales bacterium]